MGIAVVVGGGGCNCCRQSIIIVCSWLIGRPDDFIVVVVVVVVRLSNRMETNGIVTAAVTSVWLWLLFVGSRFIRMFPTMTFVTGGPGNDKIFIIIFFVNNVHTFVPRSCRFDEVFPRRRRAAPSFDIGTPGMFANPLLLAVLLKGCARVVVVVVVVVGASTNLGVLGNNPGFLFSKEGMIRVGDRGVMLSGRSLLVALIVRH